MMRMSNPLQMLLNGNQMQMLQQLQQNPIQFLRKSGYNLPDNLNDPNEIIQHLMNSGQVSQQRYNQVRQIVSQLKK